MVVHLSAKNHGPFFERILLERSLLPHNFLWFPRQPYLRELADLKDGSAAKSALLLVGKRLGWRPIDVAQTVTQPRKVARMDAMLQDMELGKLKV